jgi:D-alanyl-D-alanine dipeptidase
LVKYKNPFAFSMKSLCAGRFFSRLDGNRAEVFYNMRKFLAVFFLLFNFAMARAAAEPAAVPPDTEALLGVYQSEGESVLIRERVGGLELLYMATRGDYAFNKSNVFQMVKTRYDEYTVSLANPRDWRSTLSVKFERDRDGRGITFVFDKRRFSRLFMLNEPGGETFRLSLPQPIETMRRDALSALMPRQEDDLLTAKLVQITSVDPAIKIALSYATDQNAVGTPIYEQERAFLDEDAVRALSRVNKQLNAYGYGLIVWDAYRPWYITKLLYDILPPDQKYMLEAPETGSPYNRGLSVSVSLYSLATGQAVSLITGLDEPSPRAFSDFQGGSELERYRRGLLRFFMQSEGFGGVEHEWWHFDYKDFAKYRLLNKPFSEL